MPTKLKRYSVSLPEEIQMVIEKDADFNRRPVANQIMWILDQWYAERKKELDFFRPAPQREVKKEPPVFETPHDSPRAALIAKLHAADSREKS